MNIEANVRGAKELAERFRCRNATVGVIGLGYVGLPLLRALAAARFKVIGFDIDDQKIAFLKRGETYIRDLPAGEFLPTTDFSLAREPDALIICVPTPLTRYREPDLSFVEKTAKAIAPHLRP